MVKHTQTVRVKLECVGPKTLYNFEKTLVLLLFAVSARMKLKKYLK